MDAAFDPKALDVALEDNSQSAADNANQDGSTADNQRKTIPDLIKTIEAFVNSQLRERDAKFKQQIKKLESTKTNHENQIRDLTLKVQIYGEKIACLEKEKNRYEDKLTDLADDVNSLQNKTGNIQPVDDGYDDMSIITKGHEAVQENNCLGYTVGVKTDYDKQIDGCDDIEKSYGEEANDSLVHQGDDHKVAVDTDIGRLTAFDSFKHSMTAPPEKKRKIDKQAVEDPKFELSQKRSELQETGKQTAYDYDPLQLEQLMSQVDLLTTSDEVRAGQYKSLASEVSNTAQRVTGVEKILGKVVKGIENVYDRIEDEINGVNNSVHEVDLRIDGMEGRVNASVDVVDRRIDVLDEKLCDLESRLDEFA